MHAKLIYRCRNCKEHVEGATVKIGDDDVLFIRILAQLRARDLMLKVHLNCRQYNLQPFIRHGICDLVAFEVEDRKV